MKKEEEEEDYYHVGKYEKKLTIFAQVIKQFYSLMSGHLVIMT